jgi:hypothetical protein
MTTMMKVRRQRGHGLRLARFVLGVALVLAAGTLGGAATARAAATWDDYLDFAYIYSSADAESLATRIAAYEREVGLPLDAYVKRTLEDRDAKNGEDSTQTRRRAIAELLQYLATREPAHLENSVDTIEAFAGGESRQEDRYWYHYINAHRALERGSDTEFVRHVLGLWIRRRSPRVALRHAPGALAIADRELGLRRRPALRLRERRSARAAPKPGDGDGLRARLAGGDRAAAR